MAVPVEVRGQVAYRDVVELRPEVSKQHPELAVLAFVVPYPFLDLRAHLPPVFVAAQQLSNPKNSLETNIE